MYRISLSHGYVHLAVRVLCWGNVFSFFTSVLIHHFEGFMLTLPSMGHDFRAAYPRHENRGIVTRAETQGDRNES